MAHLNDSSAFPTHLAMPAANDAASLQQRWAHAQRRLSAELDDYRALRQRTRPGAPAWVAAQMRLAEARRRCHELAIELEALLVLLD